MSLVLFGPPGAGKGTQSELIIERDGLKHLSTGDLFRSAIQQKTPLGLEAQSYVDAGKLVPDSVVIGLIREFLENNKDESFIFDGYPRTLAQAESLELQINEIGAQKITSAVFLEVPQEMLIQRLTGRRVCRNCGAVYHVELRPTSADGVCDKCGGETYQRKDDMEEAIGTRLEAYEKSTAPLKEYYKQKGLLAEVDGLGTSEEVYGRLKEHIKSSN